MGKNLEQRVEYLEKMVEALVKEKSVSIKKNLGIGDTFELIGITWKILDITDAGHACFADRLDGDRQFDDDCNDWKSSDLRHYLNANFYQKLEDEIGADNIIEFERDLLSLDGQTEYGSCTDKVSLLTVDEYRKYRKVIPNTEKYWWWTITPHSTKNNDDSRWIAVVSPSGRISNFNCNYVSGVRPFCIFSSSIFESEGK